MSSLVTTGAVVNGICYAAPFRPCDMSILMQTIPPERIGVRGEYDHYGLAKRVWLNCCEAVGADAIAHLTVKQRGSVVILHGRIQNQSLLEQLICLAMQVEGTTNVEVRGVQVTAAA